MLVKTIKTTLTAPRVLLSKISLDDISWLFNLIQVNKNHLAARLAWANTISSLEKEENLVREMITDWSLGIKYCFTIKTLSHQKGIAS